MTLVGGYKTEKDRSIAKAVLDKFQTQILPGLVANMIAGRNPFKMPQQMRKAQAAPSAVLEQAIAQRAMLGQNAPRSEMMNRVDQRMQQREQEEEEEEDDVEEDTVGRRRNSNGEPQTEAEHQRRDLARRLRNSPRLKSLLQNAEVQSLLSYQRMRDSPLSKRRPLAMNDDDENTFRAMEARAKLDQKSQLVLGFHGFGGLDDEDSEEDENSIDPSANSFRRAPLRLSSGFVEKLKSNDELKNALERIKYRVDDVEKYLEPKPMDFNPKPQPGYFVPRKIPTRPRKMLPLLIGSDPKTQEEVRRNPSIEWKVEKESRVMKNLKNNPSLAALFMDEKLENTLKGRQLLTDEQKGRTRVKTIRALPRLFGAPTAKAEMIDAKVFQDIEERPVPPLFWEPKGRHTRLRWTGANEKEIPGLGSRFILPSLDPTMPALNTAFSTQGRARDEWDTMFKIPNNWNPGDEVGFKMNSKTKRFVGGNGAFDMPALGL
uniref:U4/U6 small nuclear ribonucleoprotein Prp3 n=1 Tax=Caenorhabditis tropicalis TaxID=1561998 RepID=A0A1I7U6X4_9PELO